MFRFPEPFSVPTSDGQTLNKKVVKNCESAFILCRFTGNTEKEQLGKQTYSQRALGDL